MLSPIVCVENQNYILVVHRLCCIICEFPIQTLIHLNSRLLTRFERHLGMCDVRLSFKQVSEPHVCDTDFLNLVAFQPQANIMLGIYPPCSIQKSTQVVIIQLYR